MKMSDRIDPSDLSEQEMDQLQSLLGMAQLGKKPCLVGPDGTQYQLPEAVFEALLKIIQGMRHRKTMTIIREDETFTTQAAANYLGMSRQFFVTLIESGKIPFHRVGSHRRVHFKDLKNYAKVRDDERRAALTGLFNKLQDDDLYDPELKEDAQ